MGSITKQDLRYYMRLATNHGMDVDDLLALRATSISLRRLGEIVCSVEMPEKESARVDKRIANLEAKASRIAARMGINIKFQGDPRGPQIYIILGDGFNSSRDLAIY